MMSERSGTAAVITGGGRGFGKAFGVALAAEGAHVALIDRDGDAAEAAAADIRAASGSASAHPAASIAARVAPSRNTT